MRMFVVGLFVGSLIVAGCAAPAPEEQSPPQEMAPATAPAPVPEGPPQPLDLGPVVPGTAPENPYSPEQIARGKALVAFGSCNDCHTPWNFDPEVGALVPVTERMLSGHPAGAPGPAGTIDPRNSVVFGPTFTSYGFPFGTTYSLNLTPDIDTGTGSWTEEMFLKIFRQVKHLGGDGRTILPPMPWPSLASLPDEDLVAIFAYLRSIPPIRNAVPSPTVPEEMMDGMAAANAALGARMMAMRAH